jgi:hypothetical protein
VEVRHKSLKKKVRASEKKREIARKKEFSEGG